MFFLLRQPVSSQENQAKGEKLTLPVQGEHRRNRFFFGRYLTLPSEGFSNANPCQSEGFLSHRDPFGVERHPFGVGQAIDTALCGIVGYRPSRMLFGVFYPVSTGSSQTHYRPREGSNLSGLRLLRRVCIGWKCALP